MKRIHKILLLVVLICICGLSLFTACRIVQEQLTEYNIQFFVDDTLYNTVVVSGNDVVSMPQDPVKEGYTFIGWWYYDNNSWQKKFTENAFLTEAISANIRVYANWKANTYTLTYNANGGSVVQDNQTVTYGQSFELQTPTYEGHTFTGWYIEEEQVNDGIWNYTNDTTIVAKWQTSAYSITYNLDGGTLASANLPTYTPDDTFKLNNPTKEGYTFVGQTGTNLTKPTLYVVIGANSTGNREYTAKWTINKYSITYNLNGGENSKNNPSEYDITSANISLKKATRRGYEFSGWYTSADCNLDSVFSTIASGSTGDIVLYAKWIATVYKISYILDGGYFEEEAQTTYTIEDDEIVIKSPVRQGYFFAGWAENNYTIPANSIGDKVFTAEWMSMFYFITYNLNGGTNDEENPLGYYTSEPSDIELANATRFGYLFDGWYTSEELVTDTKVTTITAGSTGDLTIYAKWNPIEYTIVFNKNNEKATGTMDSQVLSFDASSALSSNQFILTGYTFNGWTASSDGSGIFYVDEQEVYNLSSENGANINVYAKWEANTYSISFNYNGGNGNNDIVTSTYDSAMPTITGVPTRTGYIFTGYFDDATDGVRYYNADLTSAKVWDKAEDATLYAQWVGVSYSITFDGNGNTSETMDNQSFVYGTPQNLNENLFERTGYTFTDWNTEADGSGTTYDNSTSVNNLTSENKGTVVLYAQWIANTYRVSLNGTQTTITTEKTFTVLFDLNGASGTAPSSQTVNNTQGLTYPSIPTRSGYVFAGWYTTSSCSGNPYDFASEITSDITLYAKWVSYSGTGVIPYNGSLYVNVVSKSSSTKYYYAFVPLVSGSITIYTSGGMSDTYGFLYNSNKSQLTYDDDSGNGNNFKITYTVTAGNLYYVWPAGYSSSGSTTVYISGSNPSDGGKTIGNTTIQIDNICSNITFDSPFTLSNDILKEGHTFAGWYDGIGGTGTQYTDAEGNSVRVWDKAEDSTLYAKWNVNQYTISFVSNGGSSVDSITQNYGSNVTAPIPTWAEKSFVGWFADSGLTEEYTFDTMPAYNITLYAKWIEYDVLLSYDDTTEISINDIATSPATYNATAIDTDGNPVDVIVSVIGETFEAGKTVTVRLVATGLYNVYATKTISNIKVYGNPSIVYDTDKDYFNLTDNIDATLWSANATDTYGETLSVSLSVKETEYTAGDLVTILISATDITGNIATVEVENVKVYGAPVITRDTTKNDMKETDTIGNDLFGVTAVDSFGEILTVLTENKNETLIKGGKTITIKSSTVDSKGNTNDITYSIKVYGLPTIGDASTLSFKLDDEISIDALGVVAMDSFDNILTDVTLALSEGEQVAGETLTFIVTATDHLGNIQTKTISGIKIYGTPTITFDTERITMNVTDVINASLFSATAKDSHNGDLSITTTVENGSFAGGNIVTFKLFTQDALGNEHFVITQDVRVYSSDAIVLSYNSAATSRIKKTSIGEEFGATALDGFGEACVISIEPTEGCIMTGGNTINLYIVATDALGNTKKSDLIQNIMVYDTPTLTYQRECPYIQYGDSPYALYRMTDSFGDEILFNIEVLSGSLDVNDIIVYKITGTDKAGNVLEETRELFVLDTDESILEVYISGVKVGTQRVYKGENYTIAFSIGYYTVWYNGEDIITDNTGNSFAGWANDSGIYTVTGTRGSTIEYQIYYTMNDGTNSSSNPSTYNIESDNITLTQPTRAGYTFIGWTGTDFVGISMTVVIPTGSYGDREYEANWEARTDTAYTVNHYFENTADSDYTLFVTETLSGTSDSTISPDVINYYGFISPTVQTISINADGSAVVDYYYKRNSYILTVNTNTGEVETFTLKYEASVNDSVTIAREGYTFGGCFKDVKLSIELKTMPSSNTTVYTWWKEETKPSQFTYSGTDSITISKGYLTNNDIVIPAYIGNIPVQQIADNAFSSASITSVVIPNTVTSIGKLAFVSCRGLSSITIPDSVTNIGNNAFDHCSGLTSVTIGNGVERIGDSAFDYCSGLTSITIPDSVTTIGEYAFYSCSKLENLIIGSSVKKIGNFAFQYCSELTNVTIPNNVKTIGDSSFRYCTNLTNVVIENGVETIMYGAFYGCTNLADVTLGNNVTSIGEIAFEGCSSLTSITLPATLSNIGVVAFNNCKKLENIYYNGSVEKWCGISGLEYIMSDSRTLYIGGKQIQGHLKINDGVTVIKNSAFAYSEISAISIPDSVTSIEDNAFSECNRLGTATYAGSEEQWSTVSIGSNNEKLINAIMLFNCDGNEVTYLFVTNCDETLDSVNSVYLSNLPSLKNREGYTFAGWYDNSSLSGEAVSAPYYSNDKNTLYAKWELDIYTITYVLNGWTNSSENVSSYTVSDGTIYLLDPTKNNELFCGWYLDADFKTYVESIDCSTKKDYTLYAADFGASKGLTFIEDVLTSFYDSGIEEIVIPKIYKGYTITTINSEVFRNCGSLKHIALPDCVTSIGEDAFYGCSSLTSITIPNSVTSIDERAFRDCSGLTSITVSLGNSVYHSSGNCLIETDRKILIFGCMNSIIPNDGSVTSIDDYAFSGCSGLTSITIPNDVTSIGKNAFSGCKSLVNVYYLGTKDEWANINIFSSGNTYLTSATSYYYSSTQPTEDSDNYWHYDENGNTVIWKPLSLGLSYSINAGGNTCTVTGIGTCTDLELNIPSSIDGYLVTAIGERAFEGTSIISVIIPDSVTNIEDCAFNECSELISVAIPNSVTSIGASVFYDCTSLENISLPSGISTISMGLFSGCTSLTNVIIPNGVAKIEMCAFQKCSNLEAVTIPESVNSIGWEAFYKCTGLTSVNYLGTVDDWVQIDFYNSTANPLCYAGNLYINDNLVTGVNITKATQISAYAFYNCTSLISVTVSNSVICIEQEAFANCAALTSVTIADSVTEIQSEAFTSCTIATFYCEASSKPSGWSFLWNDSNSTVYWNV